jgi:hypothetical protein
MFCGRVYISIITPYFYFWIKDFVIIVAKIHNIFETKEDFEKKDKINRDLFGRKENNSYL